MGNRSPLKEWAYIGRARWIPLLTSILSVACLSLVCLAQEVGFLDQELLEPLIRDLASPEFLVREKATEQIAFQFNNSNMKQLEEVLKRSVELETRVRIGGILAKIKEERLQSQVKSFIRSRDPTETFGFDGWRSFSKYSGTERSARLLFLKLLDLHPELVENEIATKEIAAEIAKVLSVKISENRMQLRSSDFGDCLAFLYCLNASEDLFDHSLERTSLNTFRFDPFSGALREDQFRKALEKLLNGWGQRIENERIDCLLFFMNAEIPSSREIAVRLLHSKAIETEPASFILAMQALHRFGTKEDLPEVESWLDNRTVAASTERIPLRDASKLDQKMPAENPANPFTTYSIEFRDAALLIAYRLAGEDSSQAFPRLALHPLRGFLPESIVEPEKSDELRAARIKQWRERKKTDNPTEL